MADAPSITDRGPFTHLALSGEMDFMVRDESGKSLKDPPKPGVKDDPAKAAPALEEWKLLKKQLREVARIQSERLEQAMIVGRRWPLDDFETFLVKHPLMTLIAQRLLWAGYDSKGKLLQLLRISGEQTCVDAGNQPCSLAGLDSVGLPHPLHLDDQQKQTWRLAFADYEIMPPFPQLNREIHTLTPKEAQGTGFARPQGRIPFMVARRKLMEGNSWLRDVPRPRGHRGLPQAVPRRQPDGLPHDRPIDPAGLRGQRRGCAKVERVYFLPGINPGIGETAFVRKGGQVVQVDPGLPLADIDPVAMSEVLRDLAELGEKVGK